jgi:glycine hydroxymethyltransferase
MNYLKKVDLEIYKLIKAEEKRQQETLMMIPSENMTSWAVQEAVGSVLGNKYAEGYPFRRYYQGQANVDQIESITLERVKKAFGVPFANVQALSGAPANLAVYYALLQPGEKIMGLALAHGGHLTHGAAVNASARFYKAVNYTLGKDGVMDYDLIEKLAIKEKPAIIVAGITAYPKQLDWKKFRAIADKVGAWLMADIAHLAGLVVGGAYPSPVPWMDIITTTTHKTLRGPRGAIIMVTDRGLKRDPDVGKKINRAVFPSLQGGPHENAIAGIGVALKEAMKPKFKKYAKQIVKNSEVLARELKKYGFDLVAGGSNTHVILVDLQNKGGIGKLAAEALEAAGIVLNYNAVPWDKNPPFYPSGMRLGTPGITSRGMKEKEMIKIAGWIHEVVEETLKVKKAMKVTLDQERKSTTREKIIKKVKAAAKIRKEVKKLCQNFPVKKEY